MVLRTPRSRLTAVLTAGVLLTSCADSAEPGSTTPAPPGESQPASPAPEPSHSSTAPPPGTGDSPTSDLEPFPQRSGPAYEEASAGAALYLVDLTSAEREGYDRVVLTFEGAGTPGWQVDYEESPAAAGSGRPITVDGDAALVVHVSGLVLPTEGDGQLEPQKTDPDLPEIEEIHLEGWFEGQVQLVLGIDTAEAPVRVFADTDPTRVILDVQHVED